MNNIKFLLIGTSLSFLPQLTFAQCVATQDCETLGYTETSCNGGKGVKCPFGNKWACLTSEEEIEQQFCDKYGFIYTCTADNEIGGGEVCNNKYAFCSCVSGYEWKEGKCIQQKANYWGCQIGALYYSDGTCSFTKLVDKELLGVVVYEKTASENGWVMTISPIIKGIAWDTGSVYYTGIINSAANDSCDNTQKLVTLGNRFAAANAANNYNAGGKKWCLPSYDILYNIQHSINFSRINASIGVAGGQRFDGNINECFWSSSEQNAGGAWRFCANQNPLYALGTSNKEYEYERETVRPVMAF